MERCSKLVLTLLIATLLAGSSQAQQNKDADEKAIQNVAQSFQEAYNQQDATKLAAQWASDAIYLTPVTGDSAEGKEAIEKLFKEKFAQSKNLTKQSVTMTSLA